MVGCTVCIGACIEGMMGLALLIGSRLSSNVLCREFSADSAQTGASQSWRWQPQVSSHLAHDASASLCLLRTEF